MAFFKIFAINHKTIFSTAAILVIILLLTCSFSNTTSVFSQSPSPSDVQKGYKDFLKGETDLYDDLISAIQYIIQNVDNSTK